VGRESDRPALDMVDFLALTIYQLSLAPNAYGVRWWCMRDDMREKCRAVAIAKHAEWAAAEKREIDRADAEDAELAERTRSWPE